MTKEKRPKAKVSSHNDCRFGYPFPLSPSDDDAMLEIPNPTPSVHQTPYHYCCGLSCFFGFVQAKRKETRLSQVPQQNEIQRQVKNAHCTFLPNPKKSKNITLTTQNFKITANL